MNYSCPFSFFFFNFFLKALVVSSVFQFWASAVGLILALAERKSLERGTKGGIVRERSKRVTLEGMESQVNMLMYPWPCF